VRQGSRGGAILLVGAGLFLLSACGGDSEGRRSISGTVTYKGKKVEAGSIEFHPRGKEATLSGARIENGFYVIPAKQGLEPGTYQVKIFATEAPAAADEPGGLPGAEHKDLIPAKYNKDSTLIRDIKADTTTLDFSLD
jgi:hypothetical protein